MRVLFLYPYLPSPEAPHGSARLISALLRDVASEAHVTLVCAYRPGERDLVEGVRGLCDELIAVERPFKSDLGRVRRTTETGKTAMRRVATGYPTSVVKLRRSNLRRAIADAVASGGFDIAHVELSTLAQYGDLLTGLPSLLVDHEAGGSGDEPARWESYVRDTYPAFSRCACLSAEDAEHLRSLVPGLDVAVRRPGIAIPDRAERRPEPGRVLFFGSADHAPNREALGWIASEILPALRRSHPDARVVCAGFKGDDLEEATAARSAGVEMLGFVDDLAAELARASVVLSPVRSGRGVRIKNLETLAHGVPLVTTTLGARGLDASAFSTADDAEGLAAAVAAVLAAPDTPRGAEACRSVEESYSFEAQARWTLDAWRKLAGGG